ncbi:metallophosphoesterase [Nocardioides zeae]|uniref:Metallophosphoesterase n=1 Tax=Nocardioides imazamoxiresistens TaxID=3231893 RepID=A0ABU3PTH9_9ACTN|nr:metallophosphoesterase [Nocardioides zeae]MDT9592523.1 metallophosphoesterase [Nocardioides zeae]
MWLGLLLALALLVGWVVWLVRRLAVAPCWGEVLAEPTERRLRRGVAAAIVVGTALLVVAEVLQRSVDPGPWRPVFWVGLTWVAFVWYLTLTLALVAVVCGVLRLARRRAWRDRVARVGAIGSVAVATVVTGYGLVEAASVRTTEVDVTVADLDPALDGLRVAVVSDLHVGPVRDAGFVGSVVGRVNAADVDLVVLAGDYADGAEEHVGPYLDPLEGLEATYGAVAVTGNHEFINGDAEATLERLEGLGVTALRNDHVVVERDGAALVVAGVQDAYGTGDEAADPEAALEGVAPDEPVLYVAHQPSQVHQAAEADLGIDVQFSGHTHGGQLWPFGWLVRLDQPTLAGVDEVDGIQVVTSRGAGAWGPPVRVAAPPEVVVVTLRQG